MGDFRRTFSQTYMILHDPLTIASLIDDSLLAYLTRSVDVETKGEVTRGMTFVHEHRFPWEPVPDKNNVRVALEVRSEAAVRLFGERVFNRTGG